MARSGFGLFLQLNAQLGSLVSLLRFYKPWPTVADPHVAKGVAVNTPKAGPLLLLHMVSGSSSRRFFSPPHGTGSLHGQPGVFLSLRITPPLIALG